MHLFVFIVVHIYAIQRKTVIHSVNILLTIIVKAVQKILLWMKIYANVMMVIMV